MAKDEIARIRTRRYRSSFDGAASAACSTLIDPPGNALNTAFGRLPIPNVKG
ncbi:hypothetical protein AB0B30_30405 [Streptomyces narbonensis]|uniref:Uncharacterized protein n=1 Tax=Streptomyces narbonensis TaxID=67333 RepID=A0ABV3CHM7_9ACTN